MPFKTYKKPEGKFEFRLKAGQHVQADPDWEPTKDEVEAAKAANELLRAPSRTYRVEDKEVIVSDVDLVEKFGPEKFEYLSGAPSQHQSARAEKAGKSSLGQLPSSHPSRQGARAGHHPIKGKGEDRD